MLQWIRECWPGLLGGARSSLSLDVHDWLLETLETVVAFFCILLSFFPPMSAPEPVPVPVLLPQVRLKIARRSSHPWIFQKMVEKPAARLPGGSVVDILDRDGQWVGRGFYNGHSRIALRMLTTDPAEAIDGQFLRRRLEQAIALRRGWLGLDAAGDAYRLVHSE